MLPSSIQLDNSYVSPIVRTDSTINYTSAKLGSRGSRPDVRARRGDNANAQVILYSRDIERSYAYTVTE